MTQQIAGYIWMVRPAVFYGNPETGITNKFQQASPHDFTNEARAEFNCAVLRLKEYKINVLVSDSEDREAPDAIFPNNWISYLPDGKIVIFPMMATSRRRERSMGIPAEIKAEFAFHQLIDLSAAENKGEFLEGTGSIVFDHRNKIAYACRSERTHALLLNKLCSELGYLPVIFDARDRNGYPVYHTNVLMSIGENAVVICEESIIEEDRERVMNVLQNAKRSVIRINHSQMECFAGNLLQVLTTEGALCWIASSAAVKALKPEQVAKLKEGSGLLEIAIPTIEKVGGGSIRCMMAEVFLPRKNEMA